MCIMFVKRADQTLSPDLVAGMYHKGNKDGAGVMMVHNGEVITEKVLGTSEDEVRDLYQRYQGRDIAFHLRHQSVGSVTLEMAHPYIVTSTTLGHPRTIAMMHNGTIKDIQVEKEWSDSRNLAEFFLRDLLAANPDLLDSAYFTRLVSGLIGKSKLIFLDDRGKFTVINSGLGKHLECGAWVSTCDLINPLPVVKATQRQTHTPFQHGPFNPQQPSLLQPKPVLQGAFVEGDDGKKRFHRGEGVIVNMPNQATSSTPTCNMADQLVAGLVGIQLTVVNQLTAE